ncbi:MAG: hypothetical protein COW18_07955 [Zetaproteobacteria bacterium CG12_big_fil_rev_8_21_14_0_65_54_13]|nr:MAG: hypothetical protein COW18_07955 [Zetaproteobacteria bacterium CG12_big_fil_rev_8_21_14_0_65_54_13]PIX53847.1 MAG: hypothetical protein COZ50_11415 [Zetaproteobacteria bacterium CG_4_10_14_3_um_filter_54_28]PJA30811.1 MAG: hypothetical protein CO188_01445 [Zetaproteobacteria bacterium CG_4_9_14_3_um_filter_54_145]
MEQRLLEHLRQELPMLRSVDQIDAVHLMIGNKITRTAADLATSLVASKVEAGTLLSALLRYQWMVVQQLMKSGSADPMHVQMQAYARCLERFNQLQSSVVTACDRHWHAALKREVSARVLAEANAQWLSEGVVHLHNYFNEMPVVAMAEYRGGSDAQLSLRLSPEVGRVFSCADDMRSAWIASQDRRHKLAVRVSECRDDLLTLVVLDVQEAMKECREAVRIYLYDPILVDLRGHAGAIHARVIDISATGLKLEMEADDLIQAGEQLFCIWLLGEHKIVAEVIVRWIHADGDSKRAGVKFISLGPFSEIVRKFVFAQQQQLAGRLKQLGVPVWMKRGSLS